MNWLSRQSFLGDDSFERHRRAHIGLIGLCGGGSHFAQQLAHAGFGCFTVVDPDRVDREGTNKNRLVGIARADIRWRRRKTDIAARTIKRINPNAKIVKRPVKWQEAIEDLKACDFILGAVDSFRERDELESFCRRNLIPLADIGMTVTKVGPRNYQVSGQVMLSLPGMLCLHCLNILNPKRIRQEGDNYGAAGAQPQVVWANGTLASIAVGMVVQQFSPWSSLDDLSLCREYDGNKHLVTESAKWSWIKDRPCPHYDLIEAGDLLFDLRRPPEQTERQRSITNIIRTRLGLA